MTFLFQWLYLEQHRLILWVPALMMSGILFYFDMPYEPSLLPILGCAAFASTGLILMYKHDGLRLFFGAMCCIIAGFFLIAFRVHTLNTMMLKQPIEHITITGKIADIDDALHKKKRKLTLELIKKPQALRDISKVTLNYRLSQSPQPQIGDIITGEVSLFPYGDPVSVYSYDFRKDAYFQGVSASGRLYAINSMHEKKHTTLQNVRQQLASHFRLKIPDQAGEIAVALITGHRMGIVQSIRDMFTDSGLSHILSISGLHISLVAGIFFIVFRRLLSLVVYFSRRYNMKKMTCLLVIPATYGYVALSGYGYPALRAFCMTMLACIAIMIDRSPLNMRSLCFAAFLILCFFPESATSVSFQLSFAAVIGLIAFFEKPWNALRQNCDNRILKMVWYFFGVMLTTCVATLATTPISLYYFHTLTLNAVWGNLIAIPLTSIVIMPLCLICVLSYFIFPIDLLFVLLQYSIDMLIFIAKTVSSWPGSSFFVHQPTKWYICFFGFGFLWLCFFTTIRRFYGLIPIIGSCFSLYYTDHLPDIYMSDQGIVVGFRKEDAFYVSSKRGGFFYDQWQKELGIKNLSITQPGIQHFQDGVTLIIDPYRMDDELLQCLDCSKVLLTNGYIKRCRESSVLKIDRKILQNQGTHLIWLNPLRIISVRDHLGKRPWTPE